MGAIFGFSGPRDPQLLRRMAAILGHRGPRKAFFAETPHGSIGYRARFEEELQQRLGCGLWHDGEQTIAVAGYLAQAPSLAELLAQYRRRGLAFVNALRGAFVMVIRDVATLHLVRDGAGVRTVYYGRHAGRLIFAVEPKGVTVVPGFPRRLRPASVAQYFTFSFVPGAHTMLQDLYELPPGHHLSWDGRQEPTPKRYFVFENGAQHADCPKTHWVKRFQRLFAEAVGERLPHAEPVGIFLSGGIDSSIVAAEVAAQHRHPVKSYAIHFGPEYPNELEYARRMAEHCGTEHTEVLIRPQSFLPRLRRIIWHLDDPLGDPITVPNFELSAHVAREVRFVFNGEGGDPCFGGPKNIPMLLHHWYGGIARDRYFRERMYLKSYRRCYDEIDRLFTPEMRRAFDPRQDLEQLLTPFFDCQRPAALLDKLMLINTRLKGGHLILPKVERMTGAFALTPLAPLFDERILQLAFAMPGTLKLAAGIEKIVLKEAYHGRVPAEIIARPKSGMRVPVHFWFRRELRRYAARILSPREIRRVGIFNHERVRRLLAYDTEEGFGRYGIKLWMLLTFEIWRRIVVEGESP